LLGRGDAAAIAAPSQPGVEQLLLPPARPGTIAPVDEKKNGFPRIHPEAPIYIAPVVQTVLDCQNVTQIVKFGQFQLGTWLIEQMLENSRLRAVTNTRFDGLVGTEIRWEPGRNNELARRAARDILEDWPLIATAAARKQLSRWGLYLGVGFAQKHWYESPPSGRMIPRLEVFHPQWALWDWSARTYKCWTLDGWSLVPSPSLMVPGEPWQPPYSALGQEADTLRRWVVHEPFGVHSWREGFLLAVWASWFGHDRANRDLQRASEKLGIGIIKIKYPKATEKVALNALMSALRNLGSEAGIPVEQADKDAPQSSYDVEPFEWTGAGLEIIRVAKESAAADLAVLLLGHNTTAETKGASVGASAQVGNLIRGDIRISDCLNERSTIYLQVIRDWAEVNYGDASVAPIPVYVTDAPSENQAAAQTLFNFSQACMNLRSSTKGIDFTELANRFRVPLLPGGLDALPPDPTPAPGQVAPGAADKPPADNEDDEPGDT
jgi:hypothetical protein